MTLDNYASLLKFRDQNPSMNLYKMHRWHTFFSSYEITIIESLAAKLLYQLLFRRLQQFLQKILTSL